MAQHKNLQTANETAFLIISVLESAWTPVLLETWKYLFMIKTILNYIRSKYWYSKSIAGDSFL